MTERHCPVNPMLPCPLSAITKLSALKDLSKRLADKDGDSLTLRIIHDKARVDVRLGERILLGENECSNLGGFPV